jgi:hypothetical protein
VDIESVACPAPHAAQGRRRDVALHVLPSASMVNLGPVAVLGSPDAVE